MPENAPFLPVCEPLLGGNELEYVMDAVRTGWISSQGRYVDAFERAFAEWVGVPHAVAVCNGTVALHLALAAFGVGRGDEVLVPDFTMIATALAVCYTGAMPVFVDCQRDTWNMDPVAVEAAITPRTKGIIPMHCFGNPCDMDSLREIAARRQVFLLEDAAEAHGATHAGRKAGNLGDAAAFSFYGNKILSTGEGGMVVTQDDALARRARELKNLSFPLDGPRNYLHQEIGFNYRMSNLHAAVGLAQVERADEYAAMRRANGCLYQELLAGVQGIRQQQTTPGGIHAYWMNAIVLEHGGNRDALSAGLRRHGIDSRPLFQGMHRQPCLEKYGCNVSGSYPNSDHLADHGLYLPSASSLTQEDIRRVCRTVAELVETA